MSNETYLPPPAHPDAVSRRRQTIHRELESGFSSLLEARSSGLEVTPGELPDHRDGLQLKLVSLNRRPGTDPAAWNCEAELSGRSTLRESFCTAFSRLLAAFPLGGAIAATGGGSAVAVIGAETAGKAEYGETRHHLKRKFTARVRLLWTVDLAASTFSGGVGSAEEAAALAVLAAKYGAFGPAAAEAAVHRYFTEALGADWPLAIGEQPDFRPGFSLRTVAMANPVDFSWKDFSFKIEGVDADRTRLLERFARLAAHLPVENRTVSFAGGAAAFHFLAADSELTFSSFDFFGQVRTRGSLTLTGRFGIDGSEADAGPLPTPGRPPEIDPVELERQICAYLLEDGEESSAPTWRGGLPLKKDGLGVEFTGIVADDSRKLDNYLFSLLIRDLDRDAVLQRLAALRPCFPVYDLRLGEAPVAVMQLDGLHLERVADQGRHKCQAVVSLAVRIPS